MKPAYQGVTTRWNRSFMALATEDDASVAGGFLAVTVRPWQVMMQGDGPAGARA